MDNNDYNQQNNEFSSEQQQYDQGQYDQQGQHGASYQQYGDLEAPMSLGEWIITLIILAIPCVGFIMMFVWGFGQEKTSKKNFCRACLIFTAVSIVLSFVFSSALLALIASIPTY